MRKKEKNLRAKVVCVSTGSYYLTVGKTYDAQVITGGLFEYRITNDIGYEHDVEALLFIELSKMRSDKLGELGI